MSNFCFSLIEDIPITTVVLDNIESSYTSTVKMNSNFALIQEALDESVSKNETPIMQVDIDMNDNQLTNLGEPTLGHHAATKTYVDEIVSGVTSPTIDLSNTTVTASPGSKTQTLALWMGSVQDDKDRYNLASDGTTNDLTKVQSALDAGGIFHPREATVTAVNNWTDIPVNNTLVDLSGTRYLLNTSSNFLGAFSIGDVNASTGTQWTIVKDGQIQNENANLNGSVNPRIGSTDFILNNLFMNSTTNHRGGVLMRTTGAKRGIINNAIFDGVQNVVYFDGDQTQTWSSRVALNTIPGSTTTRDLANAAHWTTTSGNVYADIQAGKPFSVMLYDTANANNTCLLDISTGTGKNSPKWTRAGSVLTFASALPTANKQLVVTTHDPAQTPANTSQVIVTNTIAKELAGSPFTGNNPIFAYHVDRTSPASCAKDWVFGNNIWDNPTMPYTLPPWSIGGTAYLSAQNLNGFHNVVNTGMVFHNVDGQSIHIEDGSHNIVHAGVVSRDNTAYPYWATNSENLILNAFGFYNFQQGGLEFYADDDTVPFIEVVDAYNKDVRASNGIIDGANHTSALAGISLYGSRNDDPVNVRVHDITVKNVSATNTGAIALRDTQYHKRIGPNILARNTYHYGYTANELYDVRIEGGEWMDRGAGKTFRSTVSPTYFGQLRWQNPPEHITTRTGLTPSGTPQAPHACFDLGQTAFGTLSGVISSPNEAVSANRYRGVIKHTTIAWDGNTLTKTNVSSSASSRFGDLDWYVFRYLTGTPTVAAGGAGYSVGNVLTINAGTALTQATVTVATVSAGAVTSVTLTNPGHYYVQPGAGGATASAIATTGAGAGCTLNFNLAGTELWCRPTISPIAADTTVTEIEVATKLYGEIGYIITPTI